MDGRAQYGLVAGVSVAEYEAGLIRKHELTRADKEVERIRHVGFDLDWTLADPAGQGVDAVRPIRDDIKARVAELLGELGVEVVDLVPCCSPDERASGCC